MLAEFICTATVVHNGTAITLLKPDPSSTEHMMLELAKDRILFEQGAVYEVAIRKIGTKVP